MAKILPNPSLGDSVEAILAAWKKLTFEASYAVEIRAKSVHTGKVYSMKPQSSELQEHTEIRDAGGFTVPFVTTFGQLEKALETEGIVEDLARGALTIYAWKHREGCTQILHHASGQPLPKVETSDKRIKLDSGDWPIGNPFKAKNFCLVAPFLKEIAPNRFEQEVKVFTESDSLFDIHAELKICLAVYLHTGIKLYQTSVAFVVRSNDGSVKVVMPLLSAIKVLESMLS